MQQRGAEGVILGCTEIELLVKQTDIPEIPLFCSAELHIEATVRVQARLETIGSYMPAVDLSRATPGCATAVI